LSPGHGSPLLGYASPPPGPSSPLPGSSATHLVSRSMGKKGLAQ
jgi:hypothetical protein